MKPPSFPPPSLRPSVRPPPPPKSVPELYLFPTSAIKESSLIGACVSGGDDKMGGVKTGSWHGWIRHTCFMTTRHVPLHLPGISSTLMDMGLFHFNLANIYTFRQQGPCVCGGGGAKTEILLQQNVILCMALVAHDEWIGKKCLSGTRLVKFHVMRFAIPTSLAQSEHPLLRQ